MVDEITEELRQYDLEDVLGGSEEEDDEDGDEFRGFLRWFRN